jgi:hypothetical protein
MGASPLWGRRSVTVRERTIVFSDGWIPLVSFPKAAGAAVNF